MDPSQDDPLRVNGAAEGGTQDDQNVVITTTPALTPGPPIPPLGVPWLHHDNFPTIKKVCSENGLPQAKKTSVVRVLQELKKGRNHIDQQLAQLETQLLRVSDFLTGVVPTLEIAPDAWSDAVDDAMVANGNGDVHNGQHNGKAPAAAMEDKSAAIDPVATLVEEDLASDAPCTTVGLWRYLSVFAFFKAVTLEDMQEALLLEDPVVAATAEATESDDTDAVDVYESVNTLPTLDHMEMHHGNSNGVAKPTPTVNELLKLRLLGALIPDASQSENGHVKDELVESKPEVKEDSDVKMRTVEEDALLETWETSDRIVRQLRDIGLVEASTDEIMQNLSKPQDDEVSTEIRLLQSELVRQVRRNSEVKRTLRRSLERLKPWLTHDEEYQQIETKFEKMWRRKKELQRKKKHKEKKLQRKEASYKSAFAQPTHASVSS